MVSAIKHVLYKLNIVTTTKKMIYGPVHLQGMDIKYMYTLLGAIHITMSVQFMTQIYT